MAIVYELGASSLLIPWKEATFGFEAFTGGTLTTIITGYTLADGEDFTAVRAIVDTALGGPSITSVIMSVGIASEPEKFIPNFDAAQTATDFYETEFEDIMGDPTNIIIKITVIGANLDTLDDGSITFKFKTSQS